MDIKKMTANQLEKHYDELFVHIATDCPGNCMHITIDGYKYEVILDNIGKWELYINTSYGELADLMYAYECFNTMNQLIKYIHKRHKEILKELKKPIPN